MTIYLEDTAPFLLYRVGARVAGAANADYKAMGINLMSARVLITLLNGSEMVGVLAQRTGVDQPTLSHIITRLVGGGWVKKERQAHDNRTVLIALTPTGRKLAHRCVNHNQRFERLITDKLSPAQTRALKEILKQMHSNVEELWMEKA